MNYKERIAAGLCGLCGSSEKQEDKSLCPVCQEKSRLKAAAKREKAKANGMCHACNARPLAPGSKSRCAECLEVGRQGAKTTVQKRKAQGLCQSCGKCPPMLGRTICQACSERMTEVSSRRYHERRADGKCSYCNRDPVPGSTMCQYHLDKTHDYHVTCRREVINHYSNGACACSECGDQEFSHLQIDHLDGGGRNHLREIGETQGAGTNLISWIKANNFPSGFRVLCANCNTRVHVERCDEEQVSLNSPRRHNIGANP